LQLRGVILGAIIQQTAAVAIALSIIGFTLMLVFADSALSSDVNTAPVTVTGLGAWSMVIASIVYTYDGWMYAAYFSGEIKGGSGAVARSCIKAMVVVILLYVFLASALAWKVPLDSLAGNELALAKALEMVVSPFASTIVLIVAIMMLLAHQNLLYMSTPRVLQALAVDGLALKRAGDMSKGGNPVFAVMISWVISVGLIMIGGFNFLLHLSVFFYLFLYVVLIMGVIILRMRQPDTERPYRAWAHPWSTYICLIGWLFISLYQAVTEVETAIYAVIMVAVCWPVYKVLTHKS